MAESRGFLKAILDTMSEQIAVIDHQGYIRFTNKSWRSFACDNAMDHGFDWLTVNYLHVCDEAAAVGDDFGGQAAEGIRQVIRGERDDFLLEYPCHSENEPRWFIMRATAFEEGSEIYCAVSHQNITQRKLAEEKVLALSRTDGLTGVYNRRYFDEFLNLEWNRCARLSMPISLAIVDIDCFKELNDTHGHLHGDECLRRLGNLLHRYAKRPGDLCARYGGEEFALVFGNTDYRQSQKVVKQLLKAVREMSISDDHRQITTTLTVSVGLVTMYPDHSLSETDLIHNADLLLYQAKNTGKDRMVAQCYPQAHCA